MVKAKITVFDDETGQVFEQDREIVPYKDETLIGPNGCAYNIEECEFRFDFKRLKPMHICLNCKHFSCNKLAPYADNQVIIKDRCTLHPGKDDALDCCDDYEMDI